MLLAVLSAVMLFAWHPWEDNALPPALTISPRTGVGLGDGVVVDRARLPTTADARVALAERGAAASRPVALAERQVPELGVSGARPAIRAASPATPVGPPQSPSPAPAPVPVPMPVSTPAPAPAPAPIPSPQPVDAVEEAPAPPDRSTAVVKVPVRVENEESEACEGHAYVVTDEAQVLALQSLLAALTEEGLGEAVVDPGAPDSGERLYVVFLEGEPVEAVIGPGLVATICAPAVELMPDEAPEPES